MAHYLGVQTQTVQRFEAETEPLRVVFRYKFLMLEWANA